MKTCPQCGEQAQSDARFCKNCAYNFSATDVDATLPQVQAQSQSPGCPNCGSPVTPGARICSNCAAPLAGGTMVEANFNYGGQGYNAGYNAGYGAGYAPPPMGRARNRNTIIIGSIVGGVILIGLIILIIVLASGGSGPGSVVKEAVKAVENNDDAKARELAVSGMPPEMIKQFTMQNSQQIKAMGGVQSTNIKKENIDSEGKSATVEYDLKFGNGNTGSYTANLVKEESKWKLVNLF